VDGPRGAFALLFQPGFDPVTLLKTFADRELPLVEFVDALDMRHRTVLDYLASLTEAQLTRKARIPLFKQFMGTDEITIPMFVGALFGYHWNDHTGQLAKILGLPDTAGAVKPSGVPI
jgi:hypothetical protein